MEEIQIQQIITNIYDKFGYDFSKYHIHYIKQELNKFIKKKNYQNLSEISIDEELLQSLLNHSSFFFRNPEVFLSIKNNIFPYFTTLSKIKIWHVGCGRAEEVYSIAMLLAESNLLHKTEIYASDISMNALKQAQGKTYIYTLSGLPEKVYKEAGGNKKFEDYIESKRNGYFKLKDYVNIKFIQQDILKGTIIDKFNLVFCRNLLIYLQKPAYKQVLELLYKSLYIDSFLCLGAVETAFPHLSKQIEIVDAKSNLYRKIT